MVGPSSLRSVSDIRSGPSAARRSLPSVRGASVLFVPMTPDHDRSRSPGCRTGLADLLRGHRLAAGLTQTELASRAGVGVRTVRDLERGRSVAPQRTTVELLAGALDLAGPDRSAFLAAARGPVPAPRTAPAASRPPTRLRPAVRRSALPPPVTLVGRDRDVTELVGMLTADPAPRLVSLVGLTGVGKTALALSVAHAVADRHPGGVAGVLIGEGSDSAGRARRLGGGLRRGPAAGAGGRPRRSTRAADHGRGGARAGPGGRDAVPGSPARRPRCGCWSPDGTRSAFRASGSGRSRRSTYRRRTPSAGPADARPGRRSRCSPPGSPRSAGSRPPRTSCRRWPRWSAGWAGCRWPSS